MPESRHDTLPESRHDTLPESRHDTLPESRHDTLPESVPKSNRKIVETEAKSIHITPTYITVQIPGT
jgi:hypothetical protein